MKYRKVDGNGGSIVSVPSNGETRIDDVSVEKNESGILGDKAFGIDEIEDDEEHVRLERQGEAIVVRNPSGRLDDKIIARDIHRIIASYDAAEKMKVSNSLMGLTRMNPEYMDKDALQMSDQETTSMAADRAMSALKATHSISVEPTLARDADDAKREFLEGNFRSAFEGDTSNAEGSVVDNESFGGSDAESDSDVTEKDADG